MTSDCNNDRQFRLMHVLSIEQMKNKRPHLSTPINEETRTIFEQDPIEQSYRLPTLPDFFKLYGTVPNMQE